MSELRIPYNYTPRGYQIPTYNCLPQGFTRGMSIWHRRAGKDKTYINIAAREVMKRVGLYFYILPYYKQARRIIWEGMDSSGFKFIDHFPNEIIARKENQQMVLDTYNGSSFCMIGSDNIDSIVGTNPVGVIFSEYSLHKVEAWNYLRPILMENKGWALFNGTPRGKNHCHSLWQLAKDDPRWHTELLTVDHTVNEKGQPVISPEDIELERQDGMPEELIQQEFYCSFDAGLVGAYWADLMQSAAEDDRIRNVPYEPSLPVYTAWDIGWDDHTSIWFFQAHKSELHFIDYYGNRTKGFDHYVGLIRSKPYSYAEHFLPHDGENHSQQTGKTNRQFLVELGLNNVTSTVRVRMQGQQLPEGINLVRQIIPRCWFDITKCAYGIEALKSFRREFDKVNQTYLTTYVHDWSSHAATAFKNAAVGIQLYGLIGADNTPQGTADQQYAETSDNYLDDYNPMDDYLQEAA